MKESSKALIGLNKIRSYQFTYRNENALSSVDLIFNKHLSRKKAAALAGVTRDSVDGLLRNSFGDLRLILKKHIDDINQYYIEYFCQNSGFADESDFAVNVYAAIYRYFPHSENLRSLLTMRKKYPEVFGFLYEQLASRKFIPVKEIIESPLFPADEDKLNFFNIIYSASKEFIILTVDGIRCLLRNNEDDIASVVLGECSSPVSYNDYISQRSAMLGKGPGNFVKKPSPESFSNLPSVYQLQHDLYGSRNHISYPEPEHKNICNAVIKILRHSGSKMEVHEVFSALKSSFPLLHSHYELLSFIRGCKNIRLQGTRLSFKDSPDVSELHERYVFRYITGYLCKNKVYPYTSRSAIIQMFPNFRVEAILQSLNNDPFLFLKNDKGAPFLISRKWGKGKLMFCIAYNFCQPVSYAVMEKLFSEAGKDFHKKDYSIEFRHRNMMLLHENECFRIASIERDKYLNYMNS